MKLHKISTFLIAASIMSFSVSSQANEKKVLPKPDHVLFVILENHAFNNIIGSSSAPYINSIAEKGALFTNSLALTHPSQPNYIMLFSGDNQGVVDDYVPEKTPFNTPNLGSSLLKNNYSFTGYSEDLPSTGFTGGWSGHYARKHSPWINWQGMCNNCLPPDTNVSFKDFPNDFNKLPTVSFVIPNLINDMHDGEGDKRISRADKWIKTNLDNYIKWSEKHNSLFILTFDEDDFSGNNKITTIFYGKPVKSGKYSQEINHYSVLRTIEDMYKLPYAGNSAKVKPIDFCWKN